VVGVDWIAGAGMSGGRKTGERGVEAPPGFGMPGTTGVKRDGVGVGLESSSVGRAMDSGCSEDMISWDFRGRRLQKPATKMDKLPLMLTAFLPWIPSLPALSAA
jgi:hypothetical protein